MDRPVHNDDEFDSLDKVLSGFKLKYLSLTLGRRVNFRRHQNIALQNC